jgi:OPT family oligopeptide transporter
MPRGERQRMTIQHLSDEQIRNWTREEKDRWWLTTVFRGNMPQLTIRSAITGFLLGGVLSATNLYIGAKTGWTLGVGLTSVILAFATFRVLASVRLAKDFTILENNAMQSIATAAGYMTGPLISGIAAYMMVTNTLMPWWRMLAFNVVLSVLGVLIAFPMKRRFINDEQAPFPEGRACAVVLDTLYTSDPGIGLFKAKALAIAALIAGGLKFVSGEAYQTMLQCKVLGRDKYLVMSESLDAWYYRIAERGHAMIPRIFGVDIRKLGLSPTLDLAMFGAGGLMHIRYALNMFLGTMLAWALLGPWAVSRGWVMKKGVVLDAGDAFAYKDVLTGWNLWPGVGMLVCASLAAFLAKPKVIISAFAGFLGKKQQGTDVLSHIEVPLWVSWIGVPIVGGIGVILAHQWFEVKILYGALAVALTAMLTLIAANATALTSITPVGALSKITQLTFGVMAPNHPATNLMTATITTEVTSNASNLLMDIKPGYMLGAKPRQQAIGHCIGICAGAIASTPLFYLLFLPGYPGNPFTRENPDLVGKAVQDALVTKKFSFTAAMQWRGISDFINGLTGGGGLSKIIHPTALTALIVAAIIGVVFEFVRVFSKGKSPFVPVAFGLGFVLPPESSIWMFLGSLFFCVMGKVYARAKEGFGRLLWIDTQEPICAGLIAGAALTGIGDQLIQALYLQ